MELMEDEVPPPPRSIDDQKSIDLETWFYEFANTPLDSATARFQIGMFDAGNTLTLAVKRVSTGPKKGGYAYFNILKRPDESKVTIESMDGLKKKIEELRARIKVYGQSERFKQTSFAKAKSVTLVFDDMEEIQLGK